MTAWLLMSTALAGFPGNQSHGSVVLGANVVVVLGEVSGSRVGGGLDVGYQRQWFTVSWVDEQKVVFPQVELHPAPNLGVVGHLWWVDGAVQHGLAGRVGVGWPWSVGLEDGWIPGAGLAVELGPTLSSAGFVGLDTQLVVNAVAFEGRLGAVFGGGRHGERLHLGVGYPVTRRSEIPRDQPPTSTTPDTPPFPTTVVSNQTRQANAPDGLGVD